MIQNIENNCEKISDHSERKKLANLPTTVKENWPHLPTNPPVGIVSLHDVQVVTDTEADRRPMHRRIVVQTPIEGHVCFDSKDDRLGARLVQLE